MEESGHQGSARCRTSHIVYTYTVESDPITRLKVPLHNPILVYYSGRQCPGPATIRCKRVRGGGIVGRFVASCYGQIGLVSEMPESETLMGWFHGAGVRAAGRPDFRITRVVAGRGMWGTAERAWAVPSSPDLDCY